MVLENGVCLDVVCRVILAVDVSEVNEGVNVVINVPIIVWWVQSLTNCRLPVLSWLVTYDDVLGMMYDDVILTGMDT